MDKDARISNFVLKIIVEWVAPLQRPSRMYYINKFAWEGLIVEEGGRSHGGFHKSRCIPVYLINITLLYLIPNSNTFIAITHSMKLEGSGVILAEW